MKAVREGQLYFLKSPFTSTVDVKHEKTLAYILGTVSARPAVVIRAPEFWDNYNTVTVIPCLSDGYPSIPLNLVDRYGYLTESCYRFIPHNPHTIPVGRLGRFVGELDEFELDEIMYAFHWIHDKNFRYDHKTVPDCYFDVVDKPRPKSWHSIHDRRSNVEITVDNNMILKSDTHPEVTGMVLDVDFNSSVSPHILEEIKKDPDYHCTDSPLPDLDDYKRIDNTVPGERKFPKSIFREEDLCRVASRFNIDHIYYENKVKKRDISVLTKAELKNIQQDVSDGQFQFILDLYTAMEPVDAMLLGPRLPTQVLSDLLDTSNKSVSCMKRLCNVLRDMSEEEYNKRNNVTNMHNKANNTNKKTNNIQKQTTAIPTPTTNKSLMELDEIIDTIDFDKEFPKETIKSKQTKMVNKLKPFLNSKMIFSIPKSHMRDFIRLPEYIIRQAYVGKSFKSNYKKAFDQYKNILLEVNNLEA